MKFQEVLRNSAWLYISNLFSTLIGYLYWLFASRIVDPNAIGSAVAVISLSGVFNSILSLGLATGIQRFLGFAYGKKDTKLLSDYFWSALLFSVLLSILGAVILGLLAILNIGVGKFSIIQLLFAISLLLLGGGTWNQIFNALFISTLRAKYSAITGVTSSLLRLIVGLHLVYRGFGDIGIIAGYLAASITSDVINLYLVTRIPTIREFRPSLSIEILKDIIKAGLVSWLPTFLTLISQWAGFLGAYTIVGEYQTGLYYIAFAIASAIYAIPLTILNFMLPVLSGITQNKEDMLYKAIRLSLIISVPIVAIVTAYPQSVLSLLGTQYVQASDILLVLTLATLTIPLLSGVTNLVYAEGKYIQVLTIGLTTNIPRLILYPVLANIYQEIGIAWSYLIGFLMGFVTSIIVAYKNRFKPPWREYAIASLGIPPTYLLRISLPLTVVAPLALIIDMLIYMKFQLLMKSDVIEIIETFMPGVKINIMKRQDSKRG